MRGLAKRRKVKDIIIVRRIKMRKKITPVIAAAALVSALITGCGGEKKTTTSATTAVGLSGEESISEEDNTGEDTGEEKTEKETEEETEEKTEEETEEKTEEAAEENTEEGDIEEEESEEDEYEIDEHGRKKKKKKKKTEEEAITEEDEGNGPNAVATSPAATSSESTVAAGANDLSNRPNADDGTGEIKVLSKGDIAPDFTAELSGGGSFKLSDYDDKVVLINFWATWCGYCVDEMPGLERLKNDGIEGLEIVCVNCGEDEGTVDSFVSNEGYSINMAYDPYGRITNYYPSNGIPYTVVVNRGVVYKVFSGAWRYSDYKDAVESAIGK